MAIREGFDRLTEIVPGLEGQGRSESIVLKKCSPSPLSSEALRDTDWLGGIKKTNNLYIAVDHMRDVLNERQELIRRIKALGGEIPPDLQ